MTRFATFATDAEETTALAVTFEPVTGKWGVTILITDTAANVVMTNTTFGAWDAEADAVGVFGTMVKGFEDRGYMPA